MFGHNKLVIHCSECLFVLTYNINNCLYFIIANTKSVQWNTDSTSVHLTSPTVDQCEKVLSQLKETNEFWRIILESATPESSLNVFSNINESLVRGLYILHTPLDNCCVSEMSRMLTSDKTMNVLYLMSSPLPPNSLEMLSKALSSNKTIKTFLLSGDDNITDEDIPHVCKMLGVNSTLEQLYLDCSNITNFGEQQISEVLEQNNTLIILYINGNYLRNTNVWSKKNF